MVIENLATGTGLLRLSHDEERLSNIKKYIKLKGVNAQFVFISNGCFIVV